jgi:DNA-dependent protein kinase catalytic subunit
LLLTTMDVFVQEPLLDWMKNAKMTDDAAGAAGAAAALPDSGGGADATGAGASETFSEQDMGWYPARKLAIARLKLNLAHPSLITCDELATGRLANKHPFIDKAMEVAKGDPTDATCKRCVEVEVILNF